MCYYKDFMYIVNGTIHILEQLYAITLGEKPTFFIEARDIAAFLSREYWKAMNTAAETVNNKNDINARLDQLLSGKF